MLALTILASFALASLPLALMTYALSSWFLKRQAWSRWQIDGLVLFGLAGVLATALYKASLTYHIPVITSGLQMLVIYFVRFQVLSMIAAYLLPAVMIIWRDKA